MSLRIEQPKNGTARSYRRLHFVLESQTFQRLSGTAESCATAKLSRGNPQGRCRGICSERTIGITKKSRTTPAHTYKEAQKSKKKSSVLIQLSAWLRTLDMVRETGLEPVRCEPHAPQTCASASSATLALRRAVARLLGYYIRFCTACQPFFQSFYSF